MCLQAFTQMMSQPNTPAGQIEAGGSMQAAAMGINALGDLASGVTRARMARADAAAQRAAGQSRAARIRTAGETELSKARAGATGLGVSVNSGSVMEAERQIVRNVEQDAGVAILNGESRAASLETSAGYYQQGGVFAAMDGLVGAADKWKRTRQAAPMNIPPTEAEPWVR